MFLAQSIKKFIKKTFQESKNTEKGADDLSYYERDFDIESNNPATSPAYHHLIGNSWHCLGKED